MNNRKETVNSTLIPLLHSLMTSFFSNSLLLPSTSRNGRIYLKRKLYIITHTRVIPYEYEDNGASMLFPFWHWILRLIEMKAKRMIAVGYAMRRIVNNKTYNRN